MGRSALSRAELETLWSSLSSKYPAAFTTSPEESLAWEVIEAEDNEEQQQWLAACFHLQQLLSISPSDQSVRSRLANAEEHLKNDPEQ